MPHLSQPVLPSPCGTVATRALCKSRLLLVGHFPTDLNEGSPVHMVSPLLPSTSPLGRSCHGCRRTSAPTPAANEAFPQAATAGQQQEGCAVTLSQEWDGGHEYLGKHRALLLGAALEQAQLWGGAWGPKPGQRCPSLPAAGHLHQEPKQIPAPQHREQRCAQPRWLRAPTVCAVPS